MDRLIALGEVEHLTSLKKSQLYAMMKTGEFVRSVKVTARRRAWRALALSLFEYRRGNFTNAIAWGQRCLGYSDQRPTCVAMSHLVLAMAFCQLHQPAAARSELAQGRELVEAKYPARLEKIPDLGGEESGFWHDWVMARLLLREATAGIESAAGGHEP